jgi:hypothetical protein
MYTSMPSHKDLLNNQKTAVGLVRASRCLGLEGICTTCSSPWLSPGLLNGLLPCPLPGHWKMCGVTVSTPYLQGLFYTVYPFTAVFFFFFSFSFSGLGFELKAYTLSQSSSSFL